MVFYLNSTSKASLKYGSKIEGDVIKKTTTTTYVLIQNGLTFSIPNEDIIKTVPS